ncbi:Serine protease [Pseudomonas syringae pv. actinidiae]|uniref:Serine protease n=1 Tax=Pseudomonas syringae pv. actinidiae TaxID=103796 RepID=A0AAN4TJ96_PSESF|nr:Serine protease [Pseudomonas syringae pv. actinidiae]
MQSRKRPRDVTAAQLWIFDPSRSLGAVRSSKNLMPVTAWLTGRWSLLVIPDSAISTEVFQDLVGGSVHLHLLKRSAIPCHFMSRCYVNAHTTSDIV